MSTVYNLIESSSNSIINVIAWDGSNAEEMALFTSSFGYSLVEITGSDEYYSSLTGSTTGSLPSGSIYFGDYDSTQVGTFIGIFTGSASGSFTGSLQGTASYATFVQTASKLEVFITSSNWTKPSWAKTIKVVCVGGGGGGGGSFGVPSGQVTGGGGGAGGSVSMGEFDANLLPEPIKPFSLKIPGIISPLLKVTLPLPKGLSATISPS